MSDDVLNLKLSEIVLAKVQNALEDIYELDKLVTNFPGLIKQQVDTFTDSLLKALDELPNALDATVSEKLKALIESSDLLEKEIVQSKENITDLKENAKHEITKHVSLVLGDLKNDLKSLNESYREEIKKTQPISTGKVIVCCVAAVIGLSAICSGSAYFILKARHESELAKFGTGMVELSNLTEKVINLVPKNQQQDLKQKYESIMKSER